MSDLSDLFHLVIALAKRSMSYNNYPTINAGEEER
jgi:hypothetical protein